MSDARLTKVLLAGAAALALCWAAPVSAQTAVSATARVTIPDVLFMRVVSNGAPVATSSGPTAQTAATVEVSANRRWKILVGVAGEPAAGYTCRVASAGPGVMGVTARLSSGDREVARGTAGRAIPVTITCNGRPPQGQLSLSIAAAS